jgi:hypothetical protein
VRRAAVGQAETALACGGSVAVEEDLASGQPLKWRGRRLSVSLDDEHRVPFGGTWNRAGEPGLAAAGRTGGAWTAADSDLDGASGVLSVSRSGVISFWLEAEKLARRRVLVAEGDPTASARGLDAAAVQ